jgi:hypothetical protein
MTPRKNRQQFLGLICMIGLTCAVPCLLMPLSTFADVKAQNEH